MRIEKFSTAEFAEDAEVTKGKGSMSKAHTETFPNLTGFHGSIHEMPLRSRFSAVRSRLIARDVSCHTSGALNSRGPAYSPFSPSSSAIRRSRLYFTMLCRHGGPNLICPAPSRTARSAMVVSSVSPGTGAQHGAPSRFPRHAYRLQRLGHRADLVGLDQYGVGRLQLKFPSGCGRGWS